MLRVGSLFSGVGCIEKGLEATGGFVTAWNSEINPYACEVLRKHWPDVPNLGDITKIDWATVEPVDVLCGGFPCVDLSFAGKGAGIKEGTRSGLWFEYAKAIGILRPKYAVIENVGAIARRGLDIVLADLAAARYNAIWFDLRASDFGAPHRRERIFIVAYPDSLGCPFQKGYEQIRTEQERAVDKKDQKERRLFPEPKHSSWWDTESDVGRVADEPATELDKYILGERIKAIGNAVVPACAQTIGETILAIENLKEMKIQPGA